MPSHRKPPNRRNWIYTVIVVTVAAFAVIFGIGGGSKGTSNAAQDRPEPPASTVAPSVSSTTTPVHSASASPTGRASRSATATPQPPKPSASSTGLGTSSGTLGALAQRVRTQPIRIRIPALNVDAQVIAASVDTTGALEVPDNVVQAAWFQAGNAPGQPGTAIIAAHVDYAGKLGLFNQLHALKAGAIIYVTDASGVVRRFTVTTGKLAPKSDPSTVQALAAASATPGRPRLALITCGGDLNAAKHSYYDNYVLLADI